MKSGKKKEKKDLIAVAEVILGLTAHHACAITGNITFM